MQVTSTSDNYFFKFFCGQTQPLTGTIKKQYPLRHAGKIKKKLTQHKRMLLSKTSLKQPDMTVPVNTTADKWHYF